MPYRKLILAALLMAAMDAAFAGDGAYPVHEIELPAASGSQQHHLATTADGRLIASWVEVANGNSEVRFAILENKHWSKPKTVVSVEGKLGDPPVVLGLADGALAAAWMPYVKGGPNRYAADIYLARSQDQGRHWSEPFKPYGDAARIYDAQMSLTPLPDGGLALVWTDIRQVQEGAGEEGRYQLMSAIIGKDWKVGDEILLDGDVCSCCRAYTAANGNDLLTVYRDHLEGEVRDIAAIRWGASGKAVETPVHPDHWMLNGCPSNGPSVSMKGDKTAAAWFTAADGTGRVKLSFSADGGSHFLPPIEVDAQANGYANTVLLDDGSALISWRGRAGNTEELKLARVAPDGKVSHRTTAYRGGFPNWPSKYPAMEKAGNKAFLAWTDPVQKKVRLAAVDLGSGRPQRASKPHH